MLMRPRASCDIEDLMRCDGVGYACTDEVRCMTVSGSVCLSVRMRPGVLGQIRVLWQLGWHLSHSHRSANAPFPSIQIDAPRTWR